jgi:hypothetical protein
MGIADTIKGWFGSAKNTASTQGGDLSNKMESGMGAAKDKIAPHTDKIAPHTDKINDGIDAGGNKIDDMTGGKAGGMVDNGTDAAKDNINKLNP